MLLLQHRSQIQIAQLKKTLNLYKTSPLGTCLSTVTHAMIERTQW